MPYGDENTPRLEETTEDSPETVERLAREYLEGIERERGAEDPFDYTPWIAALPMDRRPTYASGQGD